MTLAMQLLAVAVSIVAAIVAVFVRRREQRDSPESPRGIERAEAVNPPPARRYSDP